MSAATFPYKVAPFPHQREALRRSAGRRAYALLMEPGTGKSKVLIDTLAYLWLEKKITGAIIVAPNGVHRDWIVNKLPSHMSDAVRWLACLYERSRAPKRFANEFKAMLADEDSLAILAVNVDSLRVERARAYMLQLLRKRACLMAIDESADISTPTSARTRKALKLGQLAPYRRILDGTCVADSPLDVYSQFAFLGTELLRYHSYRAFRHRYAEWVKAHIGNRPRPVELLRKDRQGNPQYKNLDELRERMSRHSFRVLRSQVREDMPEKLYNTVYCYLSAEQRRMYNEMLRDFMTEHANGTLVTADNVLVCYTRLQQVACGYIGVATGEPELMIDGPRPRLDTLVDLTKKYPVPTIIWARFRLDVKLIIEALNRSGIEDVLQIHSRDDAANKAFKSGAVRYVVGNAAAMGRGYDFPETEHMIFYNNYQRLLTRLQAEDRAMRLDTKHNVLITDIVAEGTIDQRVIRALRAKKNVADIVTGDPKQDWI